MATTKKRRDAARVKRVGSRERAKRAEADRLAVTFRPLAHKLARRFWRSQSGRVPLEELEGEAIACVVHAARLYDPSKGAKFITYASTAVWNHLAGFCRRWTRHGRAAASFSLLRNCAMAPTTAEITTTATISPTSAPMCPRGRG